MKGRLIKSKNKKMVFLCPDGCIADATPELLQSLLTDFQHFFDKQSWPEIDNWKKDTVTDMMFYPGKTLACITDDKQLIIFDGSVFFLVMNTAQSTTSIQSISERYAAWVAFPAQEKSAAAG